MKNSIVNIIECDGIYIAASVFTKEVDEHPIYFMSNYLLYVEYGELRLDINNQSYIVEKGEFALVRKHTQGNFTKSLDPDLGYFKEHVFVLHDAFLKEAINDFPPSLFSQQSKPFPNFARLASNPILKGLMGSISEYIDGDIQIDKPLIRLKTKEALLGMMKERPDLIRMLDEFSEPYKADLIHFMERNFTHNLTLGQFAQSSGRSLATFNREFRKIFSQTPHKWIKQKRLELANRLLRQTDKMASDIYLEVGFEDLSHFSRSFKSYFGYNPSSVKTNHT